MKKLRLPILIVACCLMMAASLVNATITCPGRQVLDEATQTCLVSKTNCTKFVSSDSTKCSASCAEGEKVYDFKVDDTTTFRQCYKCSTDTYLQLKHFSLTYSCVSKCKGYEIVDEVNKICKRCDKKVFPEEGKCQDDCGTKFVQQLEEDIDGQKSYKCTDYCRYSYVSLGDQKVCILKSECTQFLEEQSCVSKCSQGKKIEDKRNGNKYSVCVDDCDGDWNYVDDDKQGYCLLRCPVNYAFDSQGIKCIKLEDCLGNISLDQQFCYENLVCNPGEYLKQIKENVFQCSYCGKKVDLTNKQCLDECPSDYIADSKNVCIKISDCVLFSSDNSVCVDNYCIYPDIQLGNKCINPCQGKDNCKPTCPQGYYLSFNDSGFECIDICNYYLSSDKSTCANNCAQVFESRPRDDSKICHACSENEYFDYDQNSGYLTCIPLFKFAIPNVLYYLGQKLNRVSSLGSFLKIKDDMDKTFDQIFNSMKSLTDYLNGIEVIQQVSLMIQRSQTYSTNFYASNSEIKAKGFKLRVEQGRKYQAKKTDFDVSDFLSNPNYELSEFKQNFNLETDSFIVLSVMVLNNPYCSNCNYSKLFIVSDDQTYQNNDYRLLQLTQPTYTVKFAIDTSISNVEQLVCVSYDILGQMIPSVSSTKLSNDKKSVTCTFQTNAALYLDSNCTYIDKTKCINTGNGSNNGDQEASNSNILNGSILSLLMIILLLNF